MVQTTAKPTAKPTASNKPTTQRVAGSTKPKAEGDADADEEEQPKKERTDYAGTRNADGRLTAVPTDFDRKEHKPLKRPDFVSDDLYQEWKAGQLEMHGNEMLERAKKLRAQAEAVRKYGDPAQRAKVKKVQKLADMFTQMREQLAKEGIKIEDILAMGKATAE